MSQDMREHLQKAALDFDYLSADVYVFSGVVGSGKTFSCLVAGHMVKITYGMIGRILYFSPLNAPGIQTAMEYQRILPKPYENKYEIVGEHFHDTNYFAKGLETGADHEGLRMMNSLWDTPYLISSYEQFFMTIGGCCTRPLRKYHAMLGSVMIFDEYQTLPSHLCDELDSWMSFATRKLGCKFVLASGTPSCYWDNRRVCRDHGVRFKIVSEGLDQEMAEVEKNRVHMVNLGAISTKDFVSRVKEDAVSKGCTLAVNTTTVTSAYLSRKVMNELGPSGVVHVSRGLTKKDIRRAMEEITARLANPGAYGPWAAMATSIMEAGVNFSFPSAFGEYSRYCSGIQLTGRSNRHNEIPGGGWVYLFELNSESGLERLITTNPAMETSRRVLREMLEENLMGYQYCQEAFDREWKQDKALLKTARSEIDRASHEMDFRFLADAMHAVSKDDEGRTELALFVRSQALDVWEKIRLGEEIVHPHEIAMNTITMHPGRFKKLKTYTSEIKEGDLKKVTKYNRNFVGMLVWEGPYEPDFIGYLSVLL